MYGQRLSSSSYAVICRLQECSEAANFDFENSQLSQRRLQSEEGGMSGIFALSRGRSSSVISQGEEEQDEEGGEGGEAPERLLHSSRRRRTYSPFFQIAGFRKSWGGGEAGE